MKAFRFLSTAVVLAVAATVTAGSMYITVRAAAQQQDAVSSEVVAPSPALVTDSVPAVPAAPAASDSLSPEKVLSVREHSVVLDVEGGFTGRLSSLSAADGAQIAATGYTVRVLQNGGVVADTRTDSEGRFSFRGLEPGVSGILAFSETGLVLYGIRLLAPDEAAAIAGIGGNDIELDLDSAVVAGADVQLAREILISALSGGDRPSTDGVAAEGEVPAPGAGGDPVQRHEDGVLRSQLQDDGTLIGEVVLLSDRGNRQGEPLDMTVYFLRNGRVVASAVADNDGKFVVAGLNPGIHSVVGTGMDGVIAFGIDILGAANQPGVAGHSKDGEFIPASIVRAQPLSIAPIGPENLNSENFQSVTDGTSDPGAAAPVAASPAGGPGGGIGSGGGGAGGGAAGGGGGGLGGLLAGAAAGVGGYLAGQSSNDQPASPGN